MSQLIYDMKALRKTIEMATRLDSNYSSISGSGKSYSMNTIQQVMIDSTRGSIGISIGNYVLEDIYPFKVTTKSENSAWFITSYVNRMEAEKASINKKIEHIKFKLKSVVGDNSNYYKRKKLSAGFNGSKSIISKLKVDLCKFEKQLETIEEDHPEWLI